MRFGELPALVVANCCCFNPKKNGWEEKDFVGIYMGAATTPPPRKTESLHLYETQKLDDEFPFGAKGLMAAMLVFGDCNFSSVFFPNRLFVVQKFSGLLL